MAAKNGKFVRQIVGEYDSKKKSVLNVFNNEEKFGKEVAWDRKRNKGKPGQDQKVRKPMTRKQFDVLILELDREMRTRLGLPLEPLENEDSHKSALSVARSVAIAAGCPETSLPVSSGKGDVGIMPTENDITVGETLAESLMAELGIEEDDDDNEEDIQETAKK